MLRKYINSKIVITNTENIGTIDIDDENDTYIYVQSERLNDSHMLVEFVAQSDICELVPFGMANAPEKSTKVESHVDMDKVFEFEETVLNNDPFGKYSGKKLKEPILNNDIAWLDKALKTMRNKWIVDRLIYLVKAYDIKL